MEEIYKKYIGKYIRNKYGIAKITNVFTENEITYLKLDKDIVFFIDKETGMRKNDYLNNIYPILGNINLDERIKDLIDLIEVDDYVNDSKVVDIVQAPIKAVYTENQEQKLALIPIINEQIKSVVTKEMFNQVKYEVWYERNKV